MLFVSLVFLFLFLPLTLCLYYIFIKNRVMQNIILFVASLFFYAWGDYEATLVLLVSIIINWFLALIVASCRNNNLSKVAVGIAVFVDIGVLFVYKYLDFSIAQLNKLGINIPFRNVTLPIGISFFTFQALSYVIDVYRGEECQKNPLYVGLYISFFPQLIAGPIVRYKTVAEQIYYRKESISLFSSGAIRFMQGFSKKVLLANTMAVIADKAFAMVGNNLTVSFAWLGALAYMLQIYFDFSGYSDMAIGLGRMFGFEFEENFNLPYIAESITDFWRRWHISLSSWFRDYVYIPLGGSRTGKWKTYCNLFVVWLLTGIWHGANWTFIAWGILYFLFLVLEKGTLFGDFIKRKKIVGHIYTCLVVMFLWVIFRADSMIQALIYIKTMIGLSGEPIYTPVTGVYIIENVVYFIIAIMLAFGFFENKSKFFRTVDETKQCLVDISRLASVTICFVISIVYIVNGTYNPFIYFHF